MSNIVHFIHGGGFVMYPLLLLSIAAIVVIVERLVAFNQYGQVPMGLLGIVIAQTRDGRFDEAIDRCEALSGPLAACLGTVLRHRECPSREVERRVEETGQEFFIRLERFLPILDTTTTISPLLGLLGTIVGMIGAFNAIASTIHHGNNDAVLAGVGEALYATATGLVIAVVCFAAYNYFAARLRYITAETEQGATKLINVLNERGHAHRGGITLDNHAAPIVGEEKNHGVQAPSRA
ncbi:MAG: MotA/TolQ/ExbB proton channel family protein [Capsulimonadaceae bacterium]|nr:MotA/TolQ/ExbB proton channel family protein [Capsulimonadaceae bacterium]